jgi:hypothetical protein
MRSVPTVPDPDTPVTLAPLVDGQPPVTEVIGDPPVGVEESLPSLPDAPVVETCARLDGLGAADAIGAAVGVPVTAEPVGGGCRFVGGDAVVEVHDVTEAEVERDWFVRDAIEPVGAVSGDAVGLAEFGPPGSDPVPGYTIALIIRRQGAVVAVRGTGDDRSVAEAVAVFVDSTT